MANETATITKAEEKPVTETKTETKPITETKTTETAKTEEKPVTETKTEVKTETKTEAKTEPPAKTTETSDGKVETKTEEAPKPIVYDLKLPKDSPLTKEDLDRITKIAKEQEFTPEEAQGLLEYENEAVRTFDARQKVQMAEAQKAWKEATKNDKGIGGEKFAENAELAKRVIDRFGSPELKKALDQTGLGDHPELIRLVVNIGRAMSEDQLVAGSPGKQSSDKTAADKLYPTTAKAS